MLVSAQDVQVTVEVPRYSLLAVLFAPKPQPVSVTVAPGVAELGAVRHCGSRPHALPTTRRFGQMWPFPNRRPCAYTSSLSLSRGYAPFVGSDTLVWIHVRGTRTRWSLPTHRTLGSRSHGIGVARRGPQSSRPSGDQADRSVDCRIG